VFADDLNAFRAFASSVPNDIILSHAHLCQLNLHEWGRCNQVQFDASKESMHVVAKHDSHGDNFRILGIDFDCKLLMTDAVVETSTSASWKLRTLLRSRRFFTCADVISHYKSQILSFIEYRTPGIYHACSSVLSRLDGVQERLLREIGVSDADALFAFNLAPLSTRRDIAMLGVIHRCVLGLGPDQFQKFFRRNWAGCVSKTRLARRRHDKQLVDPRQGQFSEQLRRSALGLVAVYNLLPQEVVDVPTVSLFQGQLQAMLRDVAMRCSSWQELFSPRVPLYRHLLL